jgi:3-(3-hydroxy-phenyl)propionate hydroxylase
MTGAAACCDVAIIGYGPTGATLAGLLANSGCSVTVIEREADIYPLPRAVHFDDETMRIFQAVGIADQLRGRIRLNPGMRFVDADHNLLMDWPRPQEITPQGWNASYRFHQPDLEQTLRTALASRNNVSVCLETEVAGLEQLDDHIELQLRSTSGAAISTLSARFVVGCDGARSFVRSIMPEDMDDLGFKERWLVVDVLLGRDRPDLGDHTIQFCNPHRSMTYCRCPQDRRRWEIMVLDHEDSTAIARPESVWKFLEPWITPDDAELERTAVYTFRSAVAKCWRHGRCLLAGDAAHLTPPFMGQGMCTGIRDASNLAWKLAACTRGQAGPELLASYQAEREPHARAYIETAVRLGGLINALDRDSALAMAREHDGGRAVMRSIAPALGLSGIGPASCHSSPHRGTLFPQPRLSDGRLLDDIIGYRPALITRKDKGPVHHISTRNEPALEAELDRLETDAVAIRPDRYILGTATSDQQISDLSDWVARFA